MNYLEFSIDTWASLETPDIESGGYPSITLSRSKDAHAFLHLFKDNSGNYHFAIEASGLEPKDLDDPKVNGLQLQLVDYRFHEGRTSRFIDITCNISGYIEEFTEIVREISKSILEGNEQPLNAVNQIIHNWISFWANQRKDALSEEDQVGLICELITLNKLCEINPGTALETWTGPLGEKHDFNFTDWNFEVKGTRKSKKIHTINGIDQLKPSYKKHLAFVSFQLTTSVSEHSISLPELIDQLVKDHFIDKPSLTIRFNELLAGAGYNPVHSEEYEKFKVEVLESTLFEVDEDFPKLTTNMLNQPLISRVSSVRYDISLEGFAGLDFNEIGWGDYLN